MENKLEFHVISSHTMNGFIFTKQGVDIEIKSTGTPHLNMTKKITLYDMNVRNSGKGSRVQQTRTKTTKRTTI